MIQSKEFLFVMHNISNNLKKELLAQMPSAKACAKPSPSYGKHNLPSETYLYAPKELPNEEVYYLKEQNPS